MILRLVSFMLLLLLLPGTAMAQHQNYPLKPFTCPPGQWVYGFNPATHGLPGWFCRQIYPPLGGINGTFKCVISVTVSGGIVAGTTGQAGCCFPKLLTDDSGTHFLTDESGTHFLTDGGANCSQ
jgi:hypothetical protein